jgi:hypothetical protein
MLGISKGKAAEVKESSALRESRACNNRTFVIYQIP